MDEISEHVCQKHMDCTLNPNATDQWISSATWVCGDRINIKTQKLSSIFSHVCVVTNYVLNNEVGSIYDTAVCFIV